MFHFITSGAGYIGSHLAGGLVAEGHPVHVFENPVMQYDRIFHPASAVGVQLVTHARPQDA